MLPPKDETVYGESVKSAKTHVSDTGPQVPLSSHRGSMIIRSQPSIMYLTDTDDEGVQLSDFPKVPSA
jgi:hypothetical protein